MEKLRDSQTQLWPVRKTSPKTTRKQTDARRCKAKERHRFWWMPRYRNIREIQTQEQKSFSSTGDRSQQKNLSVGSATGCWVFSPAQYPSEQLGVEEGWQMSFVSCANSDQSVITYTLYWQGFEATPGLGERDCNDGLAMSAMDVGDENYSTHAKCSPALKWIVSKF